MDEQRSTDGRVLRGNARRERIIEAAVRRFAHNGYDKTRIADIARDAGMTDAGLIHHFPTKNDLFMAVIRRREAVFTPVMADEVRTVADMIVAFNVGVRSATSEPDYVLFRAMLSGASVLDDHPATAHLAMRLTESLEVLVPFVARGIVSGELLPDQDPRAIVLQLLALNDGIRAQWALLPDEVDYADTLEAATHGYYRQISGRDITDPANKTFAWSEPFPGQGQGQGPGAKHKDRGDGESRR
ncbi:AcrR family transcriptional regulator [Microbacterium resistens]|uniref:AcrR family transcriptional regulator n=1 Tax=Microbacterium resistens TaxID=156977 RepID=A0ABU1SEV5_9MICO|nr:TetR/AcrR family transcriptional regulator [Microbacterium resistens]MDR6868136.1 AcrR family transcriptional regulator [Microbacterium resistens]